MPAPAVPLDARVVEDFAVVKMAPSLAERRLIPTRDAFRKQIAAKLPAARIRAA